MVVQVPETGREKLQILDGGHSLSVDLAPWIQKRLEGARTQVLAGGKPWLEEEGDTTQNLWGLVVDIGTTTLVASLVDLRTGVEAASESALNPQALHAQDVLSRIHLGSSPEGLALLQGELIEELNRMVAALVAEAGISRERIYEAVLSGNTAMIHLAAGVDPEPLGQFPYKPSLCGGQHLLAGDLGLSLHPEALVYFPPILSAYVGPDITSGVLATRLDQASGVTLFVDIGTNGEMVLAVDGRLAATSTAAGPAFEGMNITCGMRAARGAIEGFAVEQGSIVVKTIGNAEPQGLCGSGLVDLVGELAATGALGASGRFAKSHPEPGLHERLETVEGKIRFQVAGSVHLTQKDVRQVQLAKGAVRAGIELLLQSEGLTPGDVDRVLIAGSFGYHLRTRSLINLGLLPPEFSNRVEFVGNTSKTGGRAFLLNASLREEMSEVAQRVRIVELANDPTFEKTFVAALAFPEVSQEAGVV